jgi:hypothetical protein
MDSPSSLSLQRYAELSAERLKLDRGALCEALERQVGDADFCAKFIRTRPHLFSRLSRAFLSCGRPARLLPDAVSLKISSQRSALSARIWRSSSWALVLTRV